MLRRSSRLNPPRQEISEEQRQSQIQAILSSLKPIKEMGTRKDDGTFVTAEEYHNNVTRNNIIINRNLRTLGIDVRPEAQRPPINQPEPIVSVAPQRFSESSSSHSIERPQQLFNDTSLNIVGRISNYLNSNLIILRRQQENERRELRPLTSAERRSGRILANKRILDQDISRLYSVNDQLLSFLTSEQLLYLTRRGISNNYYYRRLELFYTLPFIEKFNTLAQNILENMGTGVVETGYRYDIEYFNTLQQYYVSITGKKYKQNRTSATFETINGVTGDVNLLKHKSRTINNIVSQINKDISNEKVVLHGYIRNLDTLLNPLNGQQLEQRIITDINEFKSRLNIRLTELNNIRTKDLEEQFAQDEYETKRKNIIDVLNSLSILCLTFMIIIYKIKFFVNQTNYATYMPDIADKMYEAIGYYTMVINHDINIRTTETINRIKNIIENQKQLYSIIKSDVTRLAQLIRDDPDNQSNTLQLDFSIYTNNDSFTTIDARNRSQINESLRNPEFERRQRANLDRLETLRQNAIIRYNRELTRREEARVAREAERVARNARRQEAIEAERVARNARRQEAIEAARAARVTSATRRPVARMRTSAAAEYSINNANIIQVDSQEFDNKMEIANVNDMFKTSSNSIINKLRNKYNHYNKKLVNTDAIGFYNHLKKKYETFFNKDEPTAIIRGTIKNYVGNSIPSLFARYIQNNKDMRFNDFGKYMVANYSITIDGDDTNRRISTSRQSGIDVGGLRRDFITALTTELFDKNVGILLTREGTKKYFLNPLFKPNELFEYIINREIPDYDYDNNFNDDFYKFLAELLTFILVNDCGLEHTISSYLIASLGTAREFDDDDYLYFMLEDFPEYSVSLLNLLKMDPDQIEYVYIGFNDYFNITLDDKELTKDNIVEFMHKCSKYMMTTTILRKDVDNISAGSAYDRIVMKGRHIHDKFISGIPSVIRDYISNKNIPLLALNTYLIKPTMSQDIINKLKQNFTNSMRNARTQNRRIQNFTTLFIEYVLENKKNKENDEYFKFIDNLIRFWSGSSFYKNNENYKIQINSNLSEQHLPQSHTCFFTIDLPEYTGETNEEIGNKLHDKIEMAISNVEQGIGLAGGKSIKLKKMTKR